MHSLTRREAARLLRAAKAGPQLAHRFQSTSSSSSSSSPSSSKTPTIRAAMLIHRAPLLTPAPTPFEQSYYTYASSIQQALSNPAPTEFYFKKGSLNERRFQKIQWEREREVFGERIAGKKVDVGELPVEEELKLNERNMEEDGEIITPAELESLASSSSSSSNTKPKSSSSSSSSSPGTVSSAPTDKSKRLDRHGASHLYLLVLDKRTKKWSLPTTTITIPPSTSSSQSSTSSTATTSGESGSIDKTSSSSEPLHEVATNYVLKELGEDMDLWLVTRNPVGLIEKDGVHTFIFKSHILAGQPFSTLPSSSPLLTHAWLTKSEIQSLLCPSRSSLSESAKEEEEERREWLLQNRKEDYTIGEGGKSGEEAVWEQLEVLLNE